MPAYDYDLFVIGAGSGGVRAGRLAAVTGAKVAVAEEYRVGGTCVIRGCVPKKLMVYASEFAQTFQTAKAYGWSGLESARFDWSEFLMNEDESIAELSGIYTANLKKAGADLFEARAIFKDSHTLELVEAGGEARTVTAAKVLIATGGRPRLPDIPGAELGITSNEAFHLKALPQSIIVVGGGYIALEFACIFHALGVKTTVVARSQNLLRGFDEDVRAHLADEFRKRGLRVVLGCLHDSIVRREDGKLVSRMNNGMDLVSEQVMFATGRAPNTDGLGLDKAGVELRADGAVKVNDYSRTNVGHIWAVGDVTDRLALTPVAIREGAAFAETEFYGKPTRFDHKDVATAVFSQPTVGVVGMTEADARHSLGAVDIYMTRFRPMRTGFAGDEARMLMKLVVDASTGRVVGVHIVGPDAAEMIQLAAIAVKAGLTKVQWDETCALHPTAAEELVTLREKYTPNELAAAE